MSGVRSTDALLDERARLVAELDVAHALLKRVGLILNATLLDQPALVLMRDRLLVDIGECLTASGGSDEGKSDGPPDYTDRSGVGLVSE